MRRWQDYANERSEKWNTRPHLHALGSMYIPPSLTALRHGCIKSTQGALWLAVRQQCTTTAMKRRLPQLKKKINKKKKAARFGHKDRGHRFHRNATMKAGLRRLHVSVTQCPMLSREGRGSSCRPDDVSQTVVNINKFVHVKKRNWRPNFHLLSITSRA